MKNSVTISFVITEVLFKTLEDFEILFNNFARDEADADVVLAEELEDEVVDVFEELAELVFDEVVFLLSVVCCDAAAY